MKYDLAFSTFGKEEKHAMQRVIESNKFTMGENVKNFENQFAKYFGKKYAVMVNSGSSANLIAVASLFFRKNNPLRRGDEVIVPCISWSTTYYPLLQYGLKLKFVDVDLYTLNYDIEELKKSISRNTKMIVAVSILGNPCQLDEISTICKEKNITLFEDNCESMGAKINGKFTGTFGLVNTFSTFFSHHISTMEGGLVLTDDKEIYNLLCSLRNHGWTRDQEPDSPIYEKGNDDFYEAYRFILPGYNVRPTELQGVLGIEQLKKLPEFIKIRRENAKYFVSLFKENKDFIIQKETGESSWFSFTMILRKDSKLKREQVFKALKEAEIAFRIITGGDFLCHDVIKYFDYICAKSENAEYIHYNGFFVGNGPLDLKDKINYMYQTMKNVKCKVG